MIDLSTLNQDDLALSLRTDILGWNDYRTKNPQWKPILQEADLTGADLRGADLTEANLRGADLTEADLTEANLTEADLRKADLTGADLTEAYLQEADLTEADLRKADLTGAYLTEAYLRKADLTGADLTEAYLRKADLTGADLTEAYLQEADLTGAKGILTIYAPGLSAQANYLYAVQHVNAIYILDGRWWDTLTETRQRVQEKHGDNAHGVRYRLWLDCIEAHFATLEVQS